MAKRQLKKTIIASQGGICALTDTPLPEELSLVDTDRKTPKADGGIYVIPNTRVVDPVAHMKRHNIYRERSDYTDQLKSLFDDRVQTMRLMLKINNQLLAYERRTDSINPENVEFLKSSMKPIEDRLGAIDKKIAAAIKASTDPLVRAAINVPGFGPITVAALTVYVDLSKADTASSLWKYVGLHAASHERYEKGQAGGGNKTLRTVLWNAANVMMKMKTSPYREVYDRTKLRLSQSEIVTKTRNTQGHLIEAAWKDAKPSHRHGAALRAVMKHMLADYWYVGRTLAGLETRPLYVQEKLGHTHIVNPTERGWKF